MLAARDQENLVHGHQVAAAAKPLNQGTRGLQPKTPGNVQRLGQKTPARVKLNDENNAQTVLGKGKGKLAQPGAKNALGGPLITPGSTKARTALAPKTANGKARNLEQQTQGKKATQPFGTIRFSSGLRERTKVLREPASPELDLAKLDFEDLDIEYMPPPVQDLPDIPDDEPPLDLSVFEGRNAMQEIAASVFDPGCKKRTAEREERHRLWLLDNDRQIEEAHAMIQPCFHEPECEGWTCKLATKPADLNEPASTKAKDGGEKIKKPLGSTPSFAKPTLATTMRAAQAQPAKPPRKEITRQVPSATLGYANGRRISAKVRPSVTKMKTDKASINHAAQTGLFDDPARFEFEEAAKDFVLAMPAEFDDFN